MMNLHQFILLAALSMDGGAIPPQPVPQGPDAGTAAPKPVILEGTSWPEKPRLLTTLDGRAIVAANIAIRERMKLLVKEDKRNAGICDASPKAMDVLIFEAEGMYVVRLNPRVDRCGWADPSFNNAFEPDLYAISPERKILMRYPYGDESPIVRKPIVVDGVRWPDEARLLTTLDGRAIVAAHAAVQDLLARFAVKGIRFSERCDASLKAMDVLIFEGEGMYIVRINPRVDRCEGADPSLNAGLGAALYGVSPEGKVVARVPSTP
jgi:hypothetical protein